MIFNKNTPQCTQLKAILCRTSTINSYALHTIKITPNLLFEYQCTSGKFIGLPNQIESKLFLPEFECSIRGPIFEPFCPVDTVLRFTVFYCIVSVSINKIFIHSFVRSYMLELHDWQCRPSVLRHQRPNLSLDHCGVVQQRHMLEHWPPMVDTK